MQDPKAQRRKDSICTEAFCFKIQCFEAQAIKYIKASLLATKDVFDFKALI